VAVVGAGILGAATAWELHARGVDVLLLDAGDVSGATTGLGEGNVLCSDKDAGPELDLAVHGLALYDEVEARYGALAQIRRKGALIVHPERRRGPRSRPASGGCARPGYAASSSTRRGCTSSSRRSPGRCTGRRTSPPTSSARRARSPGRSPPRCRACGPTAG
jgi:glycine/D-amino acid oxidase-like deaminating enzyme